MWLKSESLDLSQKNISKKWKSESDNLATFLGFKGIIDRKT
ncbi:hypothetical protein PRABACTJOHN_03641 [Parabacteroides johnsonii DSM 18315]|uniref:Uncharacterized protein n=1 Tax=Parabacteroides johnsonii DSM 18315 TaxID=537006 RepID=B7BF13_9BACT|nr:hypothetical protein PRABACTJOHN_03641 [Parabacteroides johnsonii DSM 18315]